MGAAVLLWDFGDTLVDERWMRRAPAELPAWEIAWADVMATVADEWDVGRVTCRDVFEALASRTGMTIAAIEAHAQQCCRQLVFNPRAWRVAKDRRLPQALVTVNPDLFADYVVGQHELGSVFDAVVVSALEGTADKTELCDRAIARLTNSSAATSRPSLAR